MLVDCWVCGVGFGGVVVDDVEDDFDVGCV